MAKVFVEMKSAIFGCDGDCMEVARPDRESIREEIITAFKEKLDNMKPAKKGKKKPSKPGKKPGKKPSKKPNKPKKKPKKAKGEKRPRPGKNQRRG